MKSTWLFIAILSGVFFAAHSFNATFTINTSQDKKAISPYIYGGNIFSTDYSSASNDAENWTIKRQGGNALTAYNWENNYSNAGVDNGPNSNYDWLVSGFSTTKRAIPGISVTDFVDHCNARGYASIVTVQMGGWVAADNSGPVTSSPPNSRWKQIVVNKGSAYSTTPDKTDGFVYMDEMVNLLLTKYGSASTSTGVKFYELDNEPDIWSGTHPIMHPGKATCMELLNKSIQTAAMIKRMDPAAQVVGPSLCCFFGYYGLSDASDWNTVKGSHPWFVSWYLDRMKKASDSVGVRLLDVLDLHTYPAGDLSIYQGVVQAPRSLWDPKYVENSWITQSGFRQYLPYLPRLISNINTYFPGTKIGTTEFNYGDMYEPSSGLAGADVLGIYAKYGVYVANFWATHSAFEGYSSAAYKLYRNYDGNKSTFGDTIVRSTFSDTANTSMYASLKGNDLHVILINKHETDALTGTFTITSDAQYSSGEVWQFNGANWNVERQPSNIAVTNNTFTITVPMQSASHLVFKPSSGIKRGATQKLRGNHSGIWTIPGMNRVWYCVSAADRADITVTDAAGKIEKRISRTPGIGYFELDNEEGVASGLHIVADFIGKQIGEAGHNYYELIL